MCLSLCMSIYFAGPPHRAIVGYDHGYFLQDSHHRGHYQRASFGDGECWIAWRLAYLRQMNVVGACREGIGIRGWPEDTQALELFSPSQQCMYDAHENQTCAVWLNIVFCSPAVQPTSSCRLLLAYILAGEHHSHLTNRSVHGRQGGQHSEDSIHLGHYSFDAHYQDHHGLGT